MADPIRSTDRASQSQPATSVSSSSPLPQSSAAPSPKRTSVQKFQREVAQYDEKIAQQRERLRAAEKRLRQDRDKGGDYWRAVRGSRFQQVNQISQQIVRLNKSRNQAVRNLNRAKVGQRREFADGSFSSAQEREEREAQAIGRAAIARERKEVKAGKKPARQQRAEVIRQYRPTVAERRAGEIKRTDVLRGGMSQETPERLAQLRGTQNGSVLFGTANGGFSSDSALFSRSSSGIRVQEAQEQGKIEAFYKSLKVRSEQYRRTMQSPGMGETGKLVGNIGRFGLGVTAFGAQSVGFFKNIVTRPRQTISSSYMGVKEFATNPIFRQQIVRGIKADPYFFAGEVSANVAVSKPLGAGIKSGASFAKRTTTRLLPDYAPVAKTPKGEFISLPDDLSIQLQRGKMGYGASFGKQASYAGAEGLDVATAQKGLFRIFEREKIIDKPVPSGADPILEKSLFASPPEKGVAQVRPSRLGLTTSNRPASMVDFLAGDVSFARERPQIIVFRGQTIEKIPKSLSNLAKRAVKDPSARLEFARKYRGFQERPSGKFKPFGFAESGEKEFTLAPLEQIRKTGTIGRTIIDKKPVRVLRAKVVQDRALAKAMRGASSPAELSRLSGFSRSVYRTQRPTIPYSRLLSRGVAFGSLAISRSSTPRRGIQRYGGLSVGPSALSSLTRPAAFLTRISPIGRGSRFTPFTSLPPFSPGGGGKSPVPPYSPVPSPRGPVPMYTTPALFPPIKGSKKEGTKPQQFFKLDRRIKLGYTRSLAADFFAPRKLFKAEDILSTRGVASGLGLRL
jgi:hypothetical protein